MLDIKSSVSHTVIQSIVIVLIKHYIKNKAGVLLLYCILFDVSPKQHTENLFLC